MTVNKTELAWAAGFFDGEGSIFVRHTKRAKSGSGKYYPLTTVEVTVGQSRREPLDRFRAAVNVGVVNGPYKHSKNGQARAKSEWKDYYRWETAGRPNCAKVINMLWPYLSTPKKEQAEKCWAELALLKTIKSPKLPSIGA